MPVSTSKWLDHVLPQLQDCPAIVAERAVLKAAIDFCQQTGVVRFDDFFYSRPTEHRYQLDTPPGMSVQKIEGVFFDGRRLRAVAMADADEDFPGWRIKPLPGIPACFSQVETGQITLLPVQAGRVDFSVSLSPLPTSNSLPDILATHFFYGIGAGALAQLKSMSATSWFDPQGIAWQQSQFDLAVAAGMKLASNGQHRAPRRTRAAFL